MKKFMKKNLKVLSIFFLMFSLLLISLPILKASAGRTVQTLKTLDDTLHVLGNLVVDGTISALDPIANNHVATKGWVDTPQLFSSMNTSGVTKWRHYFISTDQLLSMDGFTVVEANKVCNKSNIGIATKKYRAFWSEDLSPNPAQGVIYWNKTYGSNFIQNNKYEINSQHFVDTSTISKNATGVQHRVTNWGGGTTDDCGPCRYYGIFTFGQLTTTKKVGEVSSSSITSCWNNFCSTANYCGACWQPILCVEDN